MSAGTSLPERSARAWLMAVNTVAVLIPKG
jgi:hypothetical protein